MDDADRDDITGIGKVADLVHKLDLVMYVEECQWFIQKQIPAGIGQRSGIVPPKLGQDAGEIDALAFAAA